MGLGFGQIRPTPGWTQDKNLELNVTREEHTVSGRVTEARRWGLRANAEDRQERPCSETVS